MMHTTTSVAPAQSRTWIGSIVLFPLCAYILAQHGDPTAFDTTSAMMNEGGRMLFGHFGTFMGHLGGPLLQLLLPASLIAFFTYYQYSFGQQVFLLWLGQNFVHISFTVKSGTEWVYLLELVGMEYYSVAVGSIFFLMGGLCFLLALTLPGFQDA